VRDPRDHSSRSEMKALGYDIEMPGRLGGAR
jgi:hypothetical protein